MVSGMLWMSLGLKMTTGITFVLMEKLVKTNQIKICPECRGLGGITYTEECHCGCGSKHEVVGSCENCGSKGFIIEGGLSDG